MWPVEKRSEFEASNIEEHLNINVLKEGDTMVRMQMS